MVSYIVLVPHDFCNPSFAFAGNALGDPDRWRNLLVLLSCVKLVLLP